jgi:hypothetical protein
MRKAIWCIIIASEEVYHARVDVCCRSLGGDRLFPSLSRTAESVHGSVLHRLSLSWSNSETPNGFTLTRNQPTGTASRNSAELDSSVPACVGYSNPPPLRLNSSSITAPVKLEINYGMRSRGSFSLRWLFAPRSVR